MPNTEQKKTFQHNLSSQLACFTHVAKYPKPLPQKNSILPKTKKKKMEINECQKIEVVFSEAILEYILEYE